MVLVRGGAGTFMLRMVIFFGVVAALLAASHWYLWARLVRDTRLGRGRRIATRSLITIGALVLPLWIGARYLPRELVWIPTALMFVWLGVLFYLVIVLFLFEPLRLGQRLRGAPEPTEADSAVAGSPRLEGAAGHLLVNAEESPRIDRRTALARLAGGSALAVGGVAGIGGVRSVLGEVETPEIPVHLERLPPALSGFKIAVLSDVHLGPVLGDGFMKEIVERTNALNPDAVVILGDLVDGPVRVLGRDASELGALRSRCGTFFVTGNHEYYSGVASWMKFIDGLGIQVLDNRRVLLGDRNRGGATIDLAGVHDWAAAGGAREASLRPDLPAALSERDPERELVLLAHQPKQIDGAAENGVGLQLSGHTHGGQIWPFGAVTGLVQPYIKGLHRHGDHTQIYVTNGTGFWGPPMRVLAPAEITQIILT